MGRSELTRERREEYRGGITVTSLCPEYRLHQDKAGGGRQESRGSETVQWHRGLLRQDDQSRRCQRSIQGLLDLLLLHLHLPWPLLWSLRPPQAADAGRQR